MIGPLSRPHLPFCGHLAAILDFAGGSMFLIEGVLGSKNLFKRKFIVAPNNLGLDPVSRPRRPFLGPLGAILDFSGGSMFLIEGVLGSKNLFSES